MSGNSSKNRSLLVCLVLLLATVAVFYQVCTYDFINYDDPTYVYRNPNIRAGIALKAVKWAFTTGHAANWHPLTWLSLMLDWQLFGSNPAGYHAVNLVFHIANTLLLFMVLKQMTDAFWPSAFVAALFALHPLHVESVAWVSERKDVLSAFFWILTMWAYVRFVKHPKITDYLLVIIFFALGLLSKPMIITLPFVLLLLDYWPLERFITRRSLPHLLIEKIPLFAMVFASSIVTFIVQQKGGAIRREVSYGFLIRLANASVSYLWYIIKMVWPARLAFFYPHPRQSVSILYAVISAGILLVVTVTVLKFAKNHRYIITGWFWYLGTLVPVIGLVQVGHQAAADRYSYITLTGLFIIIAWGLPALLAKWPYRRRRMVLWTASLIVLSALAVCTYLQQRYWKDSITLCERALKVTDDNYQAHFCMMEMLLEQGRVEEAIRHSAEAVRIKPDYVEALNALGLSYYCAGKIDEAVGWYRKTLEVDPCAIEAYLNLGTALAAKGEFDEAILFYNKALQIAPDFIDIHISLGRALLDGGRFTQAEEKYKEILNIQPQNAVVHNDLGVALFRQGKCDEAITHFNQAVLIDPGYLTARDNLNMALAERQKLRGGDAKNGKK